MLTKRGQKGELGSVDDPGEGVAEGRPIGDVKGAMLERTKVFSGNEGVVN